VVRAYSPLVGKEHVEVVRKSLEGWHAGDLDLVLADFGPDTEYVVEKSFVNARTLRGKDEIAAYLDDWRETVHRLRYEIRDVVDGGETVVTIGKVIGRAGADDGPEVGADLCYVTHFDGMRMARVEEYLEAGVALTAAGLG
jgi:ketosteroid isomerase-like protein